MQLMELIDRWSTEISAQYPDLQLFDDMELEPMKGTIVYQLIEARQDYCMQSGIPLTFDTPQMRALFAQLEKTRFNEFYYYEIDNDIAGYSPGDLSRGLLRQYYSLTVEPDNFGWTHLSGWTPLLLELEEGAPALASSYFYAYLLNPNSADSPEALAFMEYMAVNMEPEQRVNFFPDENDLLLEGYYFSSEIEVYEKYIPLLRQRLQSAEEDGDEDEMQAIQARIDEEDAHYQWICEENERLSAEAIAQYRAIREQIVCPPPRISMIGQDLYPLYMRFVDGQIKGDQYLAELDQKVRMMELEGN